MGVLTGLREISVYDVVHDHYSTSGGSSSTALAVAAVEVVERASALANSHPS